MDSDVNLERAVQFAVTSVLAEAQSMDSMAQNVLLAIAKGFAWDLGSMWLIDRHSGEMLCCGLWSAADIDRERFHTLFMTATVMPGLGLMGEVWTSCSPTWTHDLHVTGDPLLMAVSQFLALQTAYTVPLMSGRRLVGILQLVNYEQRLMDPHSAFLVTELANQVGQFITRHQAEMRLRESEDRFRSTFMFAPVAMALTSISGRLEMVNQAMAELTGYSIEQLLRFDLLGLSTQQGRSADAAALQAMLRDGGAAEPRDTRFQPASGEPIWVSLHISLVRDAEGRPQNFVVQAKDIDAQKSAEQILIRAKETAELAARTRAEFLARMSHEIRTPLNGMLGMTDLVLQTVLTQEQRQLLSVARNSAEGLLHIINDILDFSKNESQAIRLEEIAFNVRDCLNDVVAGLAVRADEKRLKLTVTVDAAVPNWASGDRHRLGQVLTNLLGNAIKFTQVGGVHLRAVCLANAPSGMHLRLGVADTGIGISTNKFDTIFEPFRQADEATTRKFGGTGLGLAICRQLVDLMGGRLWVESTLGEGSCFYFTAQLRHPASLDGLALPSLAHEDVLVPRHVLVAEDNPVNRLLAKTLLTRAGHRVTLVENGQQAVEAIGREQFDVVLMDVQMPEMDGIAATLAVRALEPPGRHLPIIALTAQAMHGDEERCRAAGMDGYVPKPLERKTLLRVIEAVTRRPA